MSALSKTCVCVIVTLKGFLCHFGIPGKTWTMCWTFSIGEVPRKFGGNLVAPLWKHLESMCHHSLDLSESFFGESGLNGLQMSVLQIAFNRNTDTDGPDAFKIHVHWLDDTAESCIKSMQQ